jgi:hypothetical protein
MSLGVNQKKTYLNINEGKIVKRNSQGEENLLAFIEGYLVGTSKIDREFKRETVPCWCIETPCLFNNYNIYPTSYE